MPKLAVFRHRYVTACLCLAVALAMVASTASAAPSGGKPKTGKPTSASQARDGFDVSGGISIGISIGDARRLAAQYGLTGAKPLPPGIVKNLARGKPLPPGIQKTRMPGGFIEALPQHPGHEWRMAGGDLVLVVTGTLVITDILEGVFD